MHCFILKLTETLFSGLHAERLKYWRDQYENEKKVLIKQYMNEMESYKEKKFKAHKELECVFYALQSENDAQKEQDEKNQLDKIDEVKSKVNETQFLKFERN